MTIVISPTTAAIFFLIGFLTRMVTLAILGATSGWRIL